MRSRVQGVLTSLGPFVRRAQFLDEGLTDRHLRASLAAGEIIRVRHGWYSSPSVPAHAQVVVRVGGRLTGVEALRLHGLLLEPRGVADIVVPRNASGLRRPHRRRERFRVGEGIRVHWTDVPRRRRMPSDWLATPEEALEFVLAHEPREVVVAACDGVLRYLRWSRVKLDEIVGRARPAVRRWLGLIDGRADAWGESVVRLRLADVGIRFEPQARIPGAAWIGRFDGRVSPHVLVEIDGGQHDPASGASSSFQRDREKDAAAARHGHRVLRFSYRQLDWYWDGCLAAIRRAIADDAELLRLRAEHAEHQARRARRKRRRSERLARDARRVGADRARSP